METQCSQGLYKSKDAANNAAALLMAEGKENVWIEIPHLSPGWVNASTRYMSFWVNYTEAASETDEPHQSTEGIGEV